MRIGNIISKFLYEKGKLNGKAYHYFSNGHIKKIESSRAFDLALLAQETIEKDFQSEGIRMLDSLQ
jgi:antitoxin component YwqK of YwqJK toxin-antitoxin module